MFNKIFNKLKKKSTLKKQPISRALQKRCLKSLQKIEGYLEPKQAFTMELFVNILTG